MLQEASPHQLEDALRRRLGGATVAEAAGIHPASEHLESLLETADRVAALPAAAPAPTARSGVREAVLADIAGRRAAWVHNHRVAVHRARHPLPSHGLRWTAVLGIALLLALLAGATLALAAQLAEPDSTLYGLKLQTESLLLAVNRSPTSKAGVRLELASQRFRDAEAMAAVGKGDLSVQSMNAYYDQLRQAGALLAGAPRDSSWKSVRDQFDSAEAKPIDTLLAQLQNTHQGDAAKRVQALADRFARDRVAIDKKLNPGSASPNPAPLPSGATGGGTAVQASPGASPAPAPSP